MRELLNRLKNAEGGSRELDSLISEEFRGFPFNTELRRLYGPRFTQSIDSALTLKKPEHSIALFIPATGARQKPTVNLHRPGLPTLTAKAATIELAAVIACMMAREG